MRGAIFRLAERRWSTHAPRPSTYGGSCRNDRYRRRAAIHARSGWRQFSFVPTGSPVLLASKGPHLLATFKGRFRISGTYHYGWLTDDPTATAADGDLDLYFLPNKADANLLRYWAPRGHVHEDSAFRNSDAFIGAVVPPGLREKVQKKEILWVTGTATILVEKYEVDVECDYPIYSVTLSSVVQPATLFASRSVMAVRYRMLTVEPAFTRPPTRAHGSLKPDRHSSPSYSAIPSSRTPKENRLS